MPEDLPRTADPRRVLLAHHAHGIMHERDRMSDPHGAAAVRALARAIDRLRQPLQPRTATGHLPGCSLDAALCEMGYPDRESRGAARAAEVAGAPERAVQVTIARACSLCDKETAVLVTDVPPTKDQLVDLRAKLGGSICITTETIRAAIGSPAAAP